VATVLVIDDEESVCWAFQRLLRGLGHEAVAAPTAERGLELLESVRPQLVILDVRLPGMDGLAALERIRARYPALPVLMVTAHGTMETAIEAMKRGATEYLTKPVDLETAEAAVKRILAVRRGSGEIRALRGEAARRPAAGPLVGRSPGMQEVFKLIGAVCTQDVNVLVRGESGTGKELVARAIHDNGPRAQGPFEPINCASIPHALLESELYGHERGSFTGAVRTKMGKLEHAAGGTVFLDEVGELPPESQGKLLRAVAERQIERVGGLEHIAVDVRLISATNRDLEEMVRDGQFREDLYWRLKGVTIDLPPLRERKDDIPLLTAHFLEARKAPGEVDERAVELLKAYSWPGNVRELKHAIEHAVVLARGGTVMPEHLPPHVAGRAAVAGAAADRIDRDVQDAVARLAASGRFADGELHAGVEGAWERALLRLVLEETGDNLVRASKRLGINRATLRNKLKQYGMYDAGSDREGE